ncbi:MAG: hypothetical protein MZU91_04560 [Desulfosudis oleivorans]|nr:hypothetical protein [Desulfosudis oleivorans]
MPRSSLSDNPRKLAVDILNRVDEEQAFAEPLLDAVLSSGRPGSDADRGLLTYLVYGTLRMRGLLDFLIDRFYQGKAPCAADRPPEHPPRRPLPGTLRRENPRLCRRRRGREHDQGGSFRDGRNLVNAILRNTLRGMTDVTFPGLEADPAGHIAVVHSHPRWLVERWMGGFGIEQTLALCKADNEIPPPALRVNRPQGNPPGRDGTARPRRS